MKPKTDRCHTCGGEVIAHAVGEDFVTVVHLASPLAKAAPDLLKACEIAVEYLEAFGIEKTEYVWKPLLKAIEKAKGDPNGTR